MDDGFQHRRLARDLDIVAIDATRPFGYGKVLPAGLLREPVTGLRRAHAAVLTRCDQVSPEVLAGIEEEIRRINPDLVRRAIHPRAGRDQDPRREPRSASIGWATSDCSPSAASAIRSPSSTRWSSRGRAGWVASLRRSLSLCGRRPRIRESRQEAAGAASVAHSDHAERLDEDRTAGFPRRNCPPVAYLAVELQITAGVQSLTALIDRVLGSTMPVLSCQFPVDSRLRPVNCEPATVNCQLQQGWWPYVRTTAQDHWKSGHAEDSRRRRLHARRLRLRRRHDGSAPRPRCRF